MNKLTTSRRIIRNGTQTVTGHSLTTSIRPPVKTTSKRHHATHATAGVNTHDSHGSNEHSIHDQTIFNNTHDSHNEHGGHNEEHLDHDVDHEEHDNQGEHGEEHGNGHGSGDHHVPPPSYQLQPHSYSYKPESFSVEAEQVGLKIWLISFDYSIEDMYDRYMIRIRYHGHPEFATSKMKINKTESNELILKNFLEASYIVCVSLFSSSGLPEYPPISTSDMCVDVTVGESHPIGAHHGTTGLLTPLLMAVAFVLLVIIAIGTKVKKAYLKKVKYHKNKAHGSEEPKAPSRKQSIVNAIVSANERRMSKIEKSETEQRLENILKRDVDPKWRAAAQMCTIVNSNSAYDNRLHNRRPIVIYTNSGYDNDYDFNNENEFDEEFPDLSDDEIDYDDRNEYDINGQNVRSLKSLSHVLDNKPWQQQIPQKQQKRNSVQLDIQHLEKF